MTHAAHDAWTEMLRTTLSGYEAHLLRQLAGHQLRTRQKHTPAELVEKLTAWPANAVTVDRCLKELAEPSRTLLGLIGLSRQPLWRMHSLLELLSALGVKDSLAEIRALFTQGFLFPQAQGDKPELTDFEDWLGRGAAIGHRLFAHPQVTSRALHVGWRLPSKLQTTSTANEPREADGLECFLRLGVVWQQVKQSPCRLTQQGEFFKRDHERLLADSLLNTPPADGGVALPQAGHFHTVLALALGMVRREDMQIDAGPMADSWQLGLVPALGELWAAVLEIDSWNAETGWTGLSTPPQPYASAGLLALALLAQLKPDAWVSPAEIARWLAEHHCFWHGQPAAKLVPWAQGFLLGVAFALRLVQAARNEDDQPVVRLSGVGRAVLGLGPAPVVAEFLKTLLVQPNLEIVAYRQGLAPGVIGALSRFASWTGLGAACTLQLEPESVYRGLETGCTLDSIQQTLQQRGVKEVPDAVLQSLRTWANKRERLTVYTAATLLEFHSVEELEAILGRGVPGRRISDRFLLVASEPDIDYRQLRLAGTRDYGLPPGQCVDVAGDGVTLSVDLSRADLLLETEIVRFAEAEASSNGRRVFKLTPASLAKARDRGVGLRSLLEWFPQRTGQELTPAARLLLAGADTLPLSLERRVVLEVPEAALADGLLQWPETRPLILARLGPCVLAVAESELEALLRKLTELGLACIAPPSA